MSPGIGPIDISGEGFFTNQNGFFGGDRKEYLQVTRLGDGTFQALKLVGDTNVPRGCSSLLELSLSLILSLRLSLCLRIPSECLSITRIGVNIIFVSYFFLLCDIVVRRREGQFSDAAPRRRHPGLRNTRTDPGMFLSLSHTHTHTRSLSLSEAS